jgi:hypothetical protein
VEIVVTRTHVSEAQKRDVAHLRLSKRPDSGLEDRAEECEETAVNGFKRESGVAEEGLAEGDRVGGFGLPATGDDEGGIGGDLKRS